MCFSPLKFEYGLEYSWLLPMLGDWHLLKNYQIAVMKPYFDAGLKELAQVSGYPVASIQTCGQFKRTHRFLLEAWESMYQVMMKKYFQFNENKECPDLYDEEILAIASKRNDRERLRIPPEVFGVCVYCNTI